MTIETVPTPITTINHNVMNVRLQEFVIKNDRPLSMIEFPVTMCHERIVRPSTNALCRKGLEGVTPDQGIMQWI